ncbi:uncharacterized protein ASPGLDRAFT_23827 [Aspergillus glaucus CBS 516.65]|uniref:Uncharacterized protein n=1 Tax=Aspergillus glaucus CBS 516.65 TaxID=1160497 RepID=A0A1L9VRZ1_ASPGL|nr:hypothetical protein ASPGLDRAFT_23827 [Aspergillus glaucus CBS 516.65]OJJ86662.1 hypothetical protein ASPGLDRAFT_23827 [Aspergillus glaucus CBS 516.65]
MLLGYRPGETFGYYNRAWPHEDRTEISSWALQGMLILCAAPLIAATVYMVLGRVIRSFGDEHLTSMSPKKITAIFVHKNIHTLNVQEVLTEYEAQMRTPTTGNYFPTKFTVFGRTPGVHRFREKNHRLLKRVRLKSLIVSPSDPTSWVGAPYRYAHTARKATI